MTLTDPKAYTGAWSGKKVLELMNSSQRIQKGLWGQRPDGTAYGDCEKNIVSILLSALSGKDGPWMALAELVGALAELVGTTNKRMNV